MFYGKLSDKESNTAEYPNINILQGDSRLSPGIQLLTTGSVWKIRVCFQSGFVIIFSMTEIIVLSTTKQNTQVLNIFA